MNQSIAIVNKGKNSSVKPRTDLLDLPNLIKLEKL